MAMTVRPPASKTPSPPAGPKDPAAMLAGVLSSKVRAAVLTWLVARQDAAWSLTEIARGVGMAISSVQHECYKLEGLGILAGTPVQGSRRYALDRDFPPTEPLIHLVYAAWGFPALATTALSDLGTPDAGLREASLRYRGTAVQDATLVLVGDISLDLLATAQMRIARLLDIDPDALDVAFFRADQWSARVDERDPLV
ncbi:MAG TPA: helix-turn-helix domain-containing protein, partial [Thermomicrobiales bacterium]|nr:helix-turn-helix domain-containing protein [Thermomicrobiales bacterium]